MLRVKMEFYKGILFIRCSGLFINKYIKDIEKDNILSNFVFKYVVFNINNIRLIDSYGIRYLINYSKELEKIDGKVVICQDSMLYLNKFISKINFVKEEKEVFN